MCRRSFLQILLVIGIALACSNAAFAVVVWETRITNNQDAVEQDEGPTGGLSFGSSDLEFMDDGGIQTIGLRFTNVQVPSGATITNAYVELTQDDMESDAPVHIIIQGELTPNAPAFANTPGNISTRPTTTEVAKWSPEHWPAGGSKHMTSDISAVIREIVGQDGWAVGNALVLIFNQDPDNQSQGHRTSGKAGAAAPLLHVEFTSESAHSPDPADGALVEDTFVNMIWRAGDFAVSHDVYLGLNPDEASAGTGDTFQGNQAAMEFIIGFPGFPFPEGLVPGTTYYWRIDEVNDANPNSPWTGDVWSFAMPPRTAYNPDPPDGTGFVDPNAIFSWTGGFEAKLHTVYMGTNFDDVNNAAGGAPMGFASYSPGPLELEKVYYWRVDEFDPPFTHKGDIWSFTTPGAVGNPQPANGEADVQMIATLSWTAADNAASHELYFGTDADAVGSATAASPEYIGPKALGSESHDPGGLAQDSSYAWRVDEVYPTETIKGLVWSFTTADFLLVDDFESYNDIDPPDPASNRIFDKWIDGFGTTTNGALVGNDLPPYAEQAIVHGGAQSLIYRYDNANKTSEATLTLVWPRDWTTEGITKLSLWVRGSSANAADSLFVALNGTAVVYHDDASATQLRGWNEWVIDLAAFGVDLTNVTSITIGVGTKNAPSPTGGTGTLYLDDIRLVP